MTETSLQNKSQVNILCNVKVIVTWQIDFISSKCTSNEIFTKDNMA